MKDIVKDPAEVLRTNSKDATFPLSEEILKMTAEMEEYILNSQDPKLAEKYGLRPGVGLAATQIGKALNISFIAIPSEDLEALNSIQNDEKDNLTDKTAREKKYFFKGFIVNPVIISESAMRAALESGEGCLSVPEDIEGYVPRAKKITVQYYDLEGNQHEIKLRDYPAIVFQHEIDHMHSKIYYDYINPLDAWHQDNETDYIQ